MQRKIADDVAAARTVIEHDQFRLEHASHESPQPEDTCIAEGRLAVPAHGLIVEEDTESLRVQKRARILQRKVLQCECHHAARELLAPVGARDV